MILYLAFFIWFYEKKSANYFIYIISTEFFYKYLFCLEDIMNIFYFFAIFLNLR